MISTEVEIPIYPYKSESETSNGFIICINYNFRTTFVTKSFGTTDIILIFVIEKEYTNQLFKYYPKTKTL